MIGRRPPLRFTATPSFYPLPAGTTLWRVHNRKYLPTDFASFVPRPDVENAHIGGRFDATGADPYPTYYGGFDPATALAERFLRDVEFDDKAVRRIHRIQVRNQRCSVVETKTDLSLVSLLDAAALAGVAATERLIHVGTEGYDDTRWWARWIREQAEQAQGLIWPSKRHTGKNSIVLFGDRCPDGLLSVRGTSIVDLDDEVGAVWINHVLSRCGVRIELPRRR